jgi:PIN domain nuclease of toxin-antitoxin system
VIILDTCAMVLDALSPSRLSAKAKKAIIEAEEKQQLFCADITLWEIGMLIQKKRLDPGTDTETFLQLVLESRHIKVLSIEPGIATIATSSLTMHFDPADRLIAATTIYHQGSLITCDRKLEKIAQLRTLW